MIIIEFCGPPGSGKSTLCDHIQDYYSTRGYKVENLRKRRGNKTLLDKINKFAYIIKLNLIIWRYPIYMKAIKYGAQFQNRAAYFWSKRLIEGVYRINKAQNNGIDIGFFDEAFLQYMTSISFNNELGSGWKDLLEYIDENVYCKRTLIVHCTLDFEENIRRLEKRNTYDRNFNGNRECTKEIVKNKEHKICEMSKQLKRSKVITIDLSNSDIARQTIICEINNLLNNN